MSEMSWLFQNKKASKVSEEKRPIAIYHAHNKAL